MSTHTHTVQVTPPGHWTSGLKPKEAYELAKDKAASQIFTGLVFAVTGAQVTNPTEMNNMISTHGGAVSAKVSSHTSFLICSMEAYEKGTPATDLAFAYGVPVVTESFVYDSVIKGELLKPLMFLVDLIPFEVTVNTGTPDSDDEGSGDELLDPLPVTASGSGDGGSVPCKWGSRCYNRESSHLQKYAHPKKARARGRSSSKRASGDPSSTTTSTSAAPPAQKRQRTDAGGASSSTSGQGTPNGAVFYSCGRDDTPVEPHDWSTIVGGHPVPLLVDNRRNPFHHHVPTSELPGAFGAARSLEKMLRRVVFQSPWMTRPWRAFVLGPLPAGFDATNPAQVGAILVSAVGFKPESSHALVVDTGLAARDDHASFFEPASAKGKAGLDVAFQVYSGASKWMRSELDSAFFASFPAAKLVKSPILVGGLHKDSNCLVGVFTAEFNP